MTNLVLDKENEEVIAKAADEYAGSKIEGVNMLSALRAVERKINFTEGARWAIKNIHKLKLESEEKK